MPVRVLALHGFLGSPSDWKPFGFEGVPIVPAESLAAWAQKFCEGVSGRPLLVGYSMGARLAMHAVISRPELFSGVVLVSGNPGLSSTEERRARLESDENWARRFEQEDWESVLRDWNAQPVFAGESVWRDPSVRRDAVVMLRNFSLGHQSDLRAVLESLPIPLLWIAGERDEKFAAIARSLHVGQRAPAEVWIAPGAGHRIPWEAPKAFRAKLKEWTRPDF